MQEKFKKWGKIILIGAGALIVLGLVGSFFIAKTASRQSGLSYSESYKGGSEADSLGLASVAREAADFNDSVSNNSISPQSAGSAGDIYRDGALTIKKIIKNGTLSLYVKDAEVAVKQIQDLALSVDGFVSESNIKETSSGFKSGNITIRVPVKYFEDVMNNTKAIAEEVEQENISAQDVTEEYIDLEAQINNLRAEETQYLAIMQQSFTIDDTLKVANRLSDVRGRIERAQGRLNYLSRQVDMSTIRINLTAEGNVKVFGLKWRPLIVIKRSFKDMLSELTDYIDAMIAFLFKLPAVILWIVTIGGILYITLRLLRWFYHKLFRKKEE